MALASALHHSADKTTRAQHNAPRGQKNASTEYYELSDEEEVPARGSWPPCLGEPRGPQDKVQQRTMEQIADDVPMLTLLDSSAPQMVDQLVAVPTILYFLKQTVDTRGRSGGLQGFLPGQSSSSTAEQIIDIPAPGRGVQRGLQGISQERSSTAFGGAEHRFPAATAEQNVDIPVPGSSLHGLSVPGSSSSSAASRDVRGDGFFALFTRFKKVRHHLRFWVGTASALEPMDACSL